MSDKKMATTKAAKAAPAKKPAKKVMPGMSRTGASSLAQLKAALPSANPGSHTRGEGAPLQVVLPPETLRALRLRSIDEQTTIRVLVLNALKKAGYTVPDDALVDRRRKY